MQRPLRKQMRKSMRMKLCKCSGTHPMSRFAALPSNELVLQPYSKKFAWFFHVLLKNASFWSVFSAFVLKNRSFCSVFSAILLKTYSFCSVFSAIILKNPCVSVQSSSNIPVFVVFSVQSSSKSQFLQCFQCSQPQELRAVWPRHPWTQQENTEPQQVCAIARK